MAMNLRALNIGLGKGKAEAKAAPKEKPAKKGAATSATTLEGGAPRPRSGLLAGKSFKQQMQLLFAAAAILTAVIFVFGALAIRTTTNGTAYVGAAGQMRMLSQRLAKESQQGLQGNSEAFGRLKRSRDEFAGLVESLTNGGAVGGAEVPASSDSVRPVLDKVTQLWQKTDQNIGLVLAQQKSLVTLGNAVKAINTNNPVLLDLAEQV